MKDAIAWALERASWFCLLIAYVALMWSGSMAFMFFIALFLLMDGAVQCLRKNKMPYPTLIILSGLILMAATWVRMLRLEIPFYITDDGIVFSGILSCLTYAQMYVDFKKIGKDWF